MFLSRFSGDSRPSDYPRTAAICTAWALLLFPSFCSAAAGDAFFVNLHNTTSASATLSISPPADGSYSAVAPVPGAVWNNLPFVSATMNPANNVGNPNTGSATGTYRLYTTPRPLVDSTGAN